MMIDHNTLYIAAIVIVILTLSLWILPYLKRKGIIKDSTIQDAVLVVNIINKIADKYINVSDENKSKYKKIVEIVTDVVTHVEQIAKENDNDVKKQLAFDSTMKILKKLGLSPTENDKLIIDMSIEKSVQQLPTTYKNK